MSLSLEFSRAIDFYPTSFFFSLFFGFLKTPTMTKTMMIPMAMLVCLVVAGVPVQGQMCHVAALSGGGARGAYEAGVLASLVANLAPNNVTWNVVTGISAGSIVTFGTALFAVGDEKAMAAWLTNMTNTINETNIFTHWGINWEEGLVQGLLYESGLVNTKPLREFLTQEYKLNGPVKDRKYVIGTTSLTYGQLITFNETQPQLLVDAAMASSAIPVVFPTQSFNGDTFCDGGVIQDVNVIDGILRCLEVTNNDPTKVVVDVVLCNSPHLAIKNDTTLEKYTTIDVGLRTLSILRYNSGLINTRSAQNAFPTVNWRYLIAPSGPLPGDLNFSHAALQQMYAMGQSDAVSAIKFGFGYGFDFELPERN